LRQAGPCEKKYREEDFHALLQVGRVVRIAAPPNPWRWAPSRGAN